VRVAVFCCLFLDLETSTRGFGRLVGGGGSRRVQPVERFTTLGWPAVFGIRETLSYKEIPHIEQHEVTEGYHADAKGTD